MLAIRSIRQPARFTSLPSIRTFKSSVAMFAIHPPKDHKSTFHFQESLPRLPVPALKQSTAVYLHSLKPLLPTESELTRRTEIVNDFIKPGGLGEKLQQRMIDVDRSTPQNWLDDKFWLSKAYHEWRVSLVINSNWYIICKDDPSAPNLQPPAQGFTDWQVKRAAKVVQRLLLFKDNLEGETLPPDVSRGGAFDMYQYTRIFGITRIPQHGCDTFNNVAFPTKAKHIVVLAKNQYFKVPVYDAEGKALDQAAIEGQLQAVVKEVSSADLDDPVGVLTASDRDHWSVAREDLLLAHPENRAILSEIEDALFAVSLDDYNVENKREVYNRIPFHGKEGHNRWFDKSITLTVENNGRAGVCGEHSPCDALIPAIVFDFALAEAADPNTTPTTGKADSPQRLRFKTDATVKAHIEKAQEHVSALIADSEPVVHWYETYGAEWIKKVVKVSPDAYLQMVLQLAYYRTHGHVIPTYETASLRVFKRGRTEVIRTLSVESKAFVEAYAGGEADVKTKYDLLIKATTAHNNFTKEASAGRGCDRHLLGLRLLLQPGESHPFFEDPLFSESQKWELSTSTLIAGERFNGTGFGAVYPDGYGINYLPGAKTIKWGIEAKKSSPKSDVDKFCKNIDLAMNEMRAVVEAQGQQGSAPSKL